MSLAAVSLAAVSLAAVSLAAVSAAAEEVLPVAPAGPAHRLAELLDAQFLLAAGWDAATGVLAPPAAHPLLGRRVCPVTGCGADTTRANGLCPICSPRWAASGMPLEEFIVAGRVDRLARPAGCVVPGCQRPWESSRRTLCAAHERQRRTLGRSRVPTHRFVADPVVRPLPSLGVCGISACDRQQAARGLCHAHGERLRAAERNHPNLDIGRWRRRQPAIPDSAVVVLRGLPESLVVEVLFAVQQRCRAGIKTPLAVLRPLCDTARDAEVLSLSELDARGLTGKQQRLLADMVRSSRRGMASPADQWPTDRWDLAAFGHRGFIDFDQISQPWLREAAKHWVLDMLPRRNRSGVTALRDHVNTLARFSESLRRRTDDGEVITGLGRADIDAFLHRLAYLESTAAITYQRRTGLCRMTRRVLRDLRDLGLTRPGRLLAGLAEDVALRAVDIPKQDYDTGPGRALPPEIMTQLCAALPTLEQRTYREVRVAVELLIDTGRRPEEICALAFDCLERDPDGKPTLIYTDYKNRRLNRRLPLAEATAALITEQQTRTRTRFTTTDPGQLRLLPAATRNPHGTRALPAETLSEAHRAWIDALPPLLRSDSTEFPKSLAVAYAYRHSYCQRHADAGTPPEVLRDLMGHRWMNTTQTYYRITEKRTRAAVDEIIAHQFDRHGNRVWQQASALLDHEHTRMRLGAIAVPFGTCTEPSNVKAAGQACPYRFRCLGCGHFRTDPSYLPELRNHLHALLADRERLLATRPGDLDEWARADATPTEAEITALRRLIRRVEDSLDPLDEADRSQIEQATRQLQATRRPVPLGMPTLTAPGPDPRHLAPPEHRR